MSKFYAHLISDSTGDTVFAIAKAVFTRFDDVNVKYYSWSLIVASGQIERIINIAKKKMGIIFHTISNPDLSFFLEEKCQEEQILCVGVIDKITERIAEYLQKTPTLRAGRAHVLDEEYFKRIEATNFTIAHDDGQSQDSLKKAEIILIGPSRTTKSPTSMYLAYKGYKTANLPFVLEIQLNLDFKQLKNSFFVGLYISIDQLINIRKNRLLSWNCSVNTKYISEEEVSNEVQVAKKFYLSNNIPMIDVTHNSIEETSAKIIQLYRSWKKNTKDNN